MAEVVQCSVHEGVAVVSINHPPVNALAWQVRDSLLTALECAEMDSEVRAILIAGAGKTFPAGADIAEFDMPRKEPWLPQICTQIEMCRKPVVAELHGTVLGGGFELALACHYRIGLRSTRVGLPEVKLGLIPGAGGTQRTPRLVGAKVALDMILSGRMLPLDQAPYRIFADRLVVEPEDLRAAALEFCHEAVSKGTRPSCERREGFADPVATQLELTKRAADEADGPENARREAVAAVEAAFLLPFDAGCAFEEAAFADLVASDQSKALRHAFFAERRAAKVALSVDRHPPQIKTLAILGGGMLASQLAVAALNAGLAVRWGIADSDRRIAAWTDVEDSLEDAVSAGDLTKQVANDALKRLICGTMPDMIKNADFVIRAAEGLQRSDMAEDVVCATAVAENVDQIGLRFARPAHLSRLVEVIEGPRARPDQLESAIALVKRLGKQPVHVRSSGETIGGRMMAALHRAADALADLGASPYDIDDALTKWGLELPPFLQRDATGLRIVGRVERREGGMNWSAVLAQAGRTGRASRQGFYSYLGDAATPIHDDKVLTLFDKHRADTNGVKKTDIVPLILGAMVNEGARLVDEHVAACASDIDVVMMTGHQFPRWRGGPMKAAELHGLFRVARTMQGANHPDKALWVPHPRLAALVRNGEGIEALSN